MKNKKTAIIALIVINLVLVGVLVYLLVNRNPGSPVPEGKTAPQSTEITESITEKESATDSPEITGSAETEKQPNETADISGKIENNTIKFDPSEGNCAYYYVNTKSSNLNVREKADEKSKKTGSIEKGRIVLVDTSKSSSGSLNEWVYIKYSNDNPENDDYYLFGWVKSEYLTICDSLLTKYANYAGFSSNICINYDRGKKSQADNMIQTLYNFAKNHSSAISMASYRFIGTALDEDGRYRYIYLDPKDFTGSNVENYYVYSVSPESNIIHKGGWEWFYEITFTGNSVSKIVFYIDDEQEQKWP